MEKDGRHHKCAGGKTWKHVCVFVLFSPFSTRKRVLPHLPKNLSLFQILQTDGLQTTNKMSIQLENHPLENLTAPAPAILGVKYLKKWSSGGAAAVEQQRWSRRKHSPASAVLSGSPFTGRVPPTYPPPPPSPPPPDPSHRHPVLIFWNTTPVLALTVCTGGGKTNGILTSNYNNGFI